jgi:dynamin 1-like protein
MRAYVLHGVLCFLFCRQEKETAASSTGTGSGANMEEWGEFLHLPNQRFYDFNEIRMEIVRDTDQITGKNKNVSNKAINLKIFSPHVLNLTLVDLPGITKVPTGDQSEDIEEQIKSMCLEYISNPNAIILAVTAANQDIANSDGLKMARMVDPDGVRTIGVLTKIDIMDQGTDCLDVLNNQVVPLRRGYIAVVNRSQKDIQENVSIRQALKKEAAYFQAHAKYRTVLAKCGTVNLTRSLNHVLIHHIKDCLPDIRKKVLSMLTDVQANINALGESCESGSNQSEMARLLLRLISAFAQNFSNIVEGHEMAVGSPGGGGDGSCAAGYSDSTELYGGARIAYIFNESFVNRAIKHMNPFEGLEDVDIRTAIANANGARGPSLFIPEAAFELLVRKQIERLREPGLQCIDYVFEELQRMAYHADSPEISRFPHLRDKIYEVVNRLLRQCVTPTQQMVNNLINIELCYINTAHPDFSGGKAAVAQMNKKMNRDAQAQAQGPAQASPNPAQGPPSVGNGGRSATPPATAPGLPPHAPVVQAAAPASAQPAVGGIPGGGFFELFKSAPVGVNAANNAVKAAPVANNGNSQYSSGGVVKLPPVSRCPSLPAVLYC